MRNSVASVNDVAEAFRKDRNFQYLIKARRGFPFDRLFYQLKVQFAAEELVAIAQGAEKLRGRQIDIFGIASVEDDLLGVAFSVTDTEIVAKMGRR